LRAPLDTEATACGIPGARRISPESLDDPHQLGPKDRELVFYCAGPGEAPSARMALLLKTHGYTHVHPLSGGLEGWREAGFVVEPLHRDAPLEMTGR
jgi:rhodanese-related sulfurtransferase